MIGGFFLIFGIMLFATRKSPAFWLLLLFPFLFGQMGAQDMMAQDAGEKYLLHIKKSSEAIKLDGVLDEPFWQNAEKATDFYQNFPYDTSFAQTRTVVMVSYDDQNFYLAAICYDETPGKYVIQSLKRDFSYPVSDAFAVYFDPFGDKRNGYNFTVNPLGVQREGLIQEGGGFGVTTAWDNRWFSEVKEYEDRWVAEIRIPFKSLRYKQGGTEWRINFSRNNLKKNENSSWVPVPRNFNIASLAFTGLMLWDEAPPRGGRNVSLIPYLAGQISQDFEKDKFDWKISGGGDAKILVASALNLDLTAYPDFSQVEVDVQQTNLSRFELFFPERRNFFIENSDLFASFGFRAIRPFFSRRIGLGAGVQVPIFGGARLSGSVNRDWRVGVMTMQTEGGAVSGLRSQNYIVGAVQRRLFERSNISAILVNRLGFNGFRPQGNDYNTVAGVDFNLATANNRWQGKAFYHHSFDGTDPTRKSANAIWLMYNTPTLTVMYNHEFVDKAYNAEVGFVPRKGYFRLEPIASYRFYPKRNKIFNNHGPEFYGSQYWRITDWRFTDNQVLVSYQFSLQNRSSFGFGVQNDYTYLTFPFDPSGSGGLQLEDSTGYTYWSGGTEYASDFRKRLNYSARLTYGTYFNGTKLTVGGQVSYRVQPWGNFSIAFENNNIWLPQPYNTVNLWLVGPRLEFSFTRSIFFTTFLQYNTQIRNFNINARFQWRFKPMSDLFVVLTQNHATEGFALRNFAVAFKLNYWLSF